jgi:hypothetical protein
VGLRIEMVVNNVTELRCGKQFEKLPAMLRELEQMVCLRPSAFIMRLNRPSRPPQVSDN